MLFEEFFKIKGWSTCSKAYPTGITQFVFSDVLDDSLETIASGVAAPDPYEFSEVQENINKTKLNNKSLFLTLSQKLAKIKIYCLLKDNKVFEK